MNKNMSAIGLKTIEKKRKIISDIVKSIAQTPDSSFSRRNKDGNIVVEQYGYIGEDYGIVVYGTRMENDEVKIRRWNTFAVSGETMQLSSIQFERVSNGEVYAYCEDDKTGHEFEFRLNNIIDYDILMSKSKIDMLAAAKANISGLCRIGNILFPVEKNSEYAKIREAEIETRRDLIKRFKSGDESAEKKLFDHTLEMAETVRERLKNEDILSVFEGYLLPYGEDDACFAILGDIKSVKKITNKITFENIYSLDLDVTGISLNVLINESDVVGMPMDGMRFMGICDLQGSISF